ncbi:MAG: hypothetical protein ACTHM1_04050 [Solirubrobacteraceae bacterium]
MKLHEAIDILLAENGCMYARDLADEINRRALYARADGNPVPSSQVYARIGNKTYRDRYSRDELGRVCTA